MLRNFSKASRFLRPKAVTEFYRNLELSVYKALLCYVGYASIITCCNCLKVFIFVILRTFSSISRICLMMLFSD